jgi:hypothetical protein
MGMPRPFLHGTAALVAPVGTIGGSSAWSAIGVDPADIGVRPGRTGIGPKEPPVGVENGYECPLFWQHRATGVNAASPTPERQNDRADVWRAKGDIDRAIADYDMALRLDRHRRRPIYSRGRIYEGEG